MAQWIDQRNDPNLMPFAGRGDCLRLLPGETVLVRHLGATDELKSIVHPKNERVHRTRSQFLLDEFNEFVHAISRRSRNAESARGQSFVSRLFRRRSGEGRGEQPAVPQQVQFPVHVQHLSNPENLRPVSLHAAPTSCGLAGFTGLFPYSARRISRMNSAASWAFLCANSIPTVWPFTTGN